MFVLISDYKVAFANRGIGNSPGSNSDWTHVNNAASFTFKQLNVLVFQDQVNVPVIEDLISHESTKAMAKTWELVYQLDIEDSANYDDDGDVPYSVDNSALIPDGSYSKVAYHLQLDDEFVFASMNSFVGKAKLLGIPVDWTHTGDYVYDLNIVSNAGTLTDYDGITHSQGSVEHWSNCYGSGDGALMHAGVGVWPHQY